MEKSTNTCGGTLPSSLKTPQSATAENADVEAPSATPHCDGFVDTEAATKIVVKTMVDSPSEKAEGTIEESGSSTATGTLSRGSTCLKARPWHRAFYHTTTSVLGVIAMTALPISFSYLGWAGGIILLVASTAASYYSGWLLIQLQEPHHKTYSEVADAAMGQGFSKWCVRPFQALLFFQVSVIIALVTGQSAQALEAIVGGDAHATLSLSAWVGIAGAAMFVLALIPNLSDAWQVSFVGMVSAVVGGVVLIATCGNVISTGSTEGIIFERPPSVAATSSETLDYAMGILEAFGLIAFS